MNLYQLYSTDECYRRKAECYGRKKQYELMKKYYLMAIELNNSDAMFNLGRYYEYVEKQYDLATKYYLMAIELNNSDAMYHLGVYYIYIKREYDLMKKYYLMAIELNNSDAMLSLAFYYQNTEINYDLMKKYYLMAIELNNKNALEELIRYHTIMNNFKWIYYLIYEINKNNKFNITYNYELYCYSYRGIVYDLKPFIDYRTKILSNVSKSINGRRISNFFYRITIEFLYNPVNGRLYHKNILFKYNKEAYNVMNKLFKLIKQQLLRNATSEWKNIIRLI